MRAATRRNGGPVFRPVRYVMAAGSATFPWGLFRSGSGPGSPAYPSFTLYASKLSADCFYVRKQSIASEFEASN